MLRSNPTVNVFHRGFNACNTYAHGEQAMAQVTCPVLFALGEQDQMTPPKAAQTLVKAAQAAGKAVQIRHLPSGHHQMTEALRRRWQRCAIFWRSKVRTHEECSGPPPTQRR